MCLIVTSKWPANHIRTTVNTFVFKHLPGARGSHRTMTIRHSSHPYQHTRTLLMQNETGYNSRPANNQQDHSCPVHGLILRAHCPMKPQTLLTALLKWGAALIYDTLVIVGILLFLTLLAVIVMPTHQVAPETGWFQLLILAGVTAYLAGSLKMGGQTLGMKAWRLRWNRLMNCSWPEAIGMVAAAILLTLVAIVGLVRLFS